MTSRVWVSFDSDTVVSTTPETSFFVGNPSFGAHRLTHRMRFMLFALFLLTGMSVAIAGQVLLAGGLFLYLAFYFPGIIVSLIGTGFLIKFIEQKTLMFKPVRWVLTVAFLVLMVTHAAVNIGNEVSVAGNSVPSIPLDVLSTISFVLMYLALLIYSLSYISSIYAFLLKSFKAT